MLFLRSLQWSLSTATRSPDGLTAWPVNYAETAVNTFAVNQQDIVYQADLGPNTGAIVKYIDRFNPDDSWPLLTIELSACCCLVPYQSLGKPLRGNRTLRFLKELVAEPSKCALQNSSSMAGNVARLSPALRWRYGDTEEL